MAYTSFRQLRVWQQGIEIAHETYRLTEGFPRREVYALANQMQRAGTSVPSNIAEGHQRDSTKEYLYHISVALGSLAELETQYVIARRLNYLSEAILETTIIRIHELGRGLRALQTALKRKLREK